MEYQGTNLPLGPNANPGLSVASLLAQFPVGIQANVQGRAPAQAGLANALANKQFAQSTKPVIDYSQPGTGNKAADDAAKNVDLAAAFHKSFWDGMAALGQNALKVPAVKGLVDALSVGDYSSANTASNFMKAQQEQANPDPKAPYKGLTDYLMAPITGVGQGLSAAVGNTNDQKTYSNVIAQAQDLNGIDSTSGPSKLVQGIGGFAGDLALDPVSYIPGVGLGKAAVKGAVAATDAIRGSGKIGQLAEKLGADSPEFLNKAVDAGNANPISAFLKASGQSLKDTQTARRAAEDAAMVRNTASKNPAVSYDQAVGTPDPVKDAVNANIGANPDGTPVRLPDNPDAAISDSANVVDPATKPDTNIPPVDAPEAVPAPAQPLPAAPEAAIPMPKEPTVPVPVDSPKPIPTSDPVPIPKGKIADLINNVTDADKVAKLSKVSVEASTAKRLTDAVEAHVGLKSGMPAKVEKTIEGKKVEKPVAIPGQMMEDENAIIKNAVIKRQSGIERGFETSIKKDRTNTSDPKTGGAVNGGRWEAASSIDLFNQAIYSMKRVEAHLQKEHGTNVRMTIPAKIDYIMRQIDAVEKDLKVVGVQPYASYINTARKVTDESGKSIDFRDKVPLSLGDTLRSIPLSLVRKHLIGNKGTEAIQSLAMHAAAESLYRGMKAGHTDEQLIADIHKVFTGDKSIFTTHVHTGSNDQGTLLNAITGEKRIGKEDHGIKRFVANIQKYNPKLTAAQATKQYHDMALDSATKMVANKDAIYNNLSSHVLANKKLTSVDAGLKASEIATNVSNRIMKMAEKPMGSMEWFDALDDQLKAATKAAEESGNSELFHATSDAIDALRDKYVPLTSQKAISAAKRGAANADKSWSSVRKIAERNAINHEDAAESAKQGEIAVKELNKGDEYSSMDLTPSAAATDAMRKRNWLEAFVNPNMLMENSKLGPYIKDGQHSVGMSQRAFNTAFAKLKLKTPADTFKKLQMEARNWDAAKGAFQSLDPEVSKLYKYVSLIFDVNSSKSVLHANGVSVDNFMEMSAKKGINYDHMGLDSSSIPEEIKSPNDLWMHANVSGMRKNLSEDAKVMDYLSRSFSSIIHITEQQSVASQAAKMLGKKLPEEGYVRVNWDPNLRKAPRKGMSDATLKAQKDHGFYDFLDKELYYPKEAAEEFANVHRVMNEVRTLDPNTPMGKFFANVFDPMTNVLKATQTTLRPGHWTTNLLGDLIRNHLAGISNPNRYYYNLKVMKAIGHDIKMYGDDPVAGFARRQEIRNGEFGRGDTGAGTIPLIFNGKRVNYDMTRMGRGMERGTYLSSHGAGINEDPLDELGPTAKISRGIVRVTDFLTNNPKFSLNKWSAARDNLTRGALAIDVAMKGNWKSEEEMFSAMNATVRKWAPTSTDFTAAEAKTARRAILYYTWMRGMAVRIADVATSKPGVAIVGNKALYNLAVANGVNPQSIGNPFPIDQQFPSYYLNNVLGPQFKGPMGDLWGFSPYSPFIDVADTLLNNQTLGGVLNGQNAVNAGSSLLGMTTPLIKMPVDLATGQSNGIPIKDNAEYIQDNLSGSLGNLISKASGKELYNPTLGRTDSNNSNIHGGDQGANAVHELVNYLSGLKVTNFNGPAAERSVKGENNAAKLLAKLNTKR